MSDARRAANCTWPNPTQPTLLTCCRRKNPVKSVTRKIGEARCLAQLQGRCRVSLTVGVVCVELWSPLPARYTETVTLCSRHRPTTAQGYRQGGVMGVSKHPLRWGLVLNCDRSTVKRALQNTQNDCYQWLSNSSRVHQIRCRPWFRCGPRWGSLQRSPRPPSWFKRPISKGSGGKRTGKKGKGRRGKVGEEVGEGQGTGGMEGKG